MSRGACSVGAPGVAARALSLAATALTLAACPAGSPAPGPGPEGAARPVPSGAVVTLALGDRPLGIAAAGSHLYCALEGASALVVLDEATHQEVDRLALKGPGGFVRTMPDRRQVLVLDTGSGELLVLDAGVHPPPGPGATPPPARGQLLHRLAVGAGAGRLALGDDNQSARVTTAGQARAVRFTFQADRTLAPTRAELAWGAPADPALPAPIDLKGGLVLAPGGASGEVQTIGPDADVRQALGSLGALGPLALGLSAAEPKVALLGDVGRQELVLAALPTGDRTVIGEVAAGLTAIVVDSNRRWAFLAQPTSPALGVVDYEARALLTRLPLRHAPATVALAPPVPGEVWAVGDDGALSVIDCTGALPVVKATAQVGKGPHHITFWGTRGYVANQADGTLSVVDRVALR